MAISGTSRFKLLDPVTESGSEVAQNIGMWQKIQGDLDLLEVLASQSANGVVGSHFNNPAAPWWLIGTAWAGGGSATFGHASKHQVKLTAVGAVSGGFTLEYDATAANAEADAFYMPADANTADFMLEFRFNTNINTTNHRIRIGVGQMNAGGNIGAAAPDKGIYLDNNTISANWFFNTKGLRGAGDQTSVNQAINNNDNDVTFKSVRCAVFNSQAPKRCYFYYDKDGLGDWILLDTLDIDTAPVNPVKPFAQVTRVAGAVAGDLFLDYWMIRPLSVKDL